jgi:hypothetical protein
VRRIDEEERGVSSIRSQVIQTLDLLQSEMKRRLRETHGSLTRDGSDPEAD